jgi:hypothetical protein
MSQTKRADGTVVVENEMYEFPHWNDTAVCCDCGAEMDVPEMGECDDFEEPYWRREDAIPPCNDTFEALCESCYSKAVSAIIGGEE